MTAVRLPRHYNIIFESSRVWFSQVEAQQASIDSVVACLDHANLGQPEAAGKSVAVGTAGTAELPQRRAPAAPVPRRRHVGGKAAPGAVAASLGAW